MRMIGDVFECLDRFHVKGINFAGIYDLGLNMFRDKIVRDGGRIRSALLDRIARERRGEAVADLKNDDFAEMLAVPGSDHDGVVR